MEQKLVKKITKHDLQPKHECSICSRPTDYYKVDEFWFCIEHAKVEDPDEWRDNEENR